MIVSFEYEDLDTGWRLQPTRFGDLNLLVGPSGVGKTRILNALLNIRGLGLKGVAGLPSCTWNLELRHRGQNFRWQGESRVTFQRQRNGESEDSDAHIVREIIVVDELEVVSRDPEHFRLGDVTLPRLDRSLSAVRLLGDDDPDLIHLKDGLTRLRELRELWIFGALSSISQAEQLRQEYRGDLDRLKASSTLTFLKLYVLQEDYRELFEQIRDEFIAIFPTVEGLWLATPEEMGFRPRQDEAFMTEKLVLGLKEEGVGAWVGYKDWSAGMLKTLVFLIETILAPDGTVFLIDELENGLGVNCLPEVAGRMLEGLDRVQYIATSHHPQVINRIPMDRWKLVTRRGSRVKVMAAQELDSLSDVLRLERFTQLLNSPEYMRALG